MSDAISRRALIKNVALTAAGIGLVACERPRANASTAAADTAAPASPDEARLDAWIATIRREELTRTDVPLGRSATRVGELAVGTPYEAYTLEAYLRAGGSPVRTEPLTLSLTKFDCVSLVESCIAVSRAADEPGAPSWEKYGHEMERMRYRGGMRGGYTSRLHYFSEWITDGAKRGLHRELGAELGGVEDRRPLRFMTEHRSSYPALANDDVYHEIGEMERTLDGRPRHVIPTARIPEVSDRIESGDILAFATAIPGLDVTHSAFAYRDAANVLRVLHAPLSGGVVEITRTTLPEYVAAIRRSTGILVARPLRA
ncbi:MAG: N-acetylmuramoyl-L-alanine amidase-like domain-containing protein [Gemmatimonadaceae bacterium]